jgi:hypothetical protein
MYIDEIKKKKVTRLQDYTLEEVKEIKSYRKSYKTRRCEKQSKIPNIFFKLAKQEKTSYSSYFYFQDNYPCTVEGIQELSKLAEQGYIGAMEALAQYFAKHDDHENPWWDLMLIQTAAEETLKEEYKYQENIDKYIEQAKIKRNEQKQRKKEKAERIKKAEERERYIKEQLPAERAKQIEKFGCIMPKALMKGKTDE